MPLIMPNTDIVLCKNVPLDASYDHTVTFASQAAQLAYFYSKAVKVIHENSYQRAMKNRLRIACTMEEAVQCNYLYFQNTSFENKTFYAFITGWEYINNVTTEITYELDVIQTFWFDIDIKACFVEREHSLTDVVGANTVPENLEQGEYIVDGYSNFEPYTRSESGSVIVEAGGCAIFYCTFYEREQSDPLYSTDPFPAFRGGVANQSVYTGLVPIKKVTYHETTSPNYGNPAYPETIDGFLAKVQEAGKIDGIIAAYICPFRPNTYDTIEWDFNVPKHTTLASYTPKNKKLLTYPYNVLRVRTDSDSTIYRWEFFRTANAQFKMQGYIVPDPCLTLIPSNYNASTNRPKCIENRLTIKEYPQFAIDADVWKVYFAQHGASLVTSMIGSAVETGAKIVGAVGGAMVGGAPFISVASALGPTMPTQVQSAPMASNMSGIDLNPVSTLNAASSLTGIASALAQIYEIQKRPPELKGTQTSMSDYAMGAKKFYADNLCIRPEYARIIDDYFSMFGYATHRVKVPNITGRPYWNYVKTQGAVLDIANAPQPYIQKVIDCFNRGITFWHDPANVGNYALDNSPSF